MFHRFVGEFQGELVTRMYKIQDLLEPTSKKMSFPSGDWNVKVEKAEGDSWE